MRRLQGEEPVNKEAASAKENEKNANPEKLPPQEALVVNQDEPMGKTRENMDAPDNILVNKNNVSQPIGVDSNTLNKMDAAAMRLNDSSALEKLHSSSATTSWYQPYETTLLLIVILHFIFFHQWNRKRTKKQTMVSYRILVQKKHWHKCVLAILSHPPADLNNRQSRRRRQPSLAVSFGNEESASTQQEQAEYNPNNNTTRRRVHACWTLTRRVFVWLRHWFQPLIHGHLSGLPLLAYNSHILWSCRALEPALSNYNKDSDTWEYLFVLLGLTFVALMLELRLTRNVLGMNSDFVVRMNRANVDSTTRVGRTVLNRSIGTMTMTCAALLIVYRGVFPFVPLKILPFWPWTFAQVMDPSLSYWMCVLLLVMLSWRSHPVTSVLCGTMSGLFWNSGLTSFLSHRYWGCCFFASLVLLCALSMNSSSSRTAAFVPCIDYVAWDHRGRLRGRQDELSSSSERDDLDDDHDDDDDSIRDHDAGSNGGADTPENGSGPYQREAPQSQHERDVEMGPLLHRRSSSRTSSFEDVPLDTVDDMQVPESSSSNYNRGLSRRGGASLSLQGSMDDSPSR